MASNLRKADLDGQLYVNVQDLMKLMVEIMTMEGLHPEAVRAIDGLGMGISLALGIVTLADLPESTQLILRERYGHD